MTKQFRPMLSGTCKDMGDVTFPIMVSPKLDGIRCVIVGGVAVSRNLKPIANPFIQEQLSGLPDGFDGELIVGDATAPGMFARTSSGVMCKKRKEVAFTFHVFDWYGAAGGFADRLNAADEWLIANDPEEKFPAQIVDHYTPPDFKALIKLEESVVADGYEGIMIRSVGGPYKCGRSTTKEGYLLKVKRWEDAEATVCGMVEEMFNGNEKETDALGRTKRSTRREGKRGKGALGALECRLPSGVEFEIGSGFTAEQRQSIWASEVPEVIGSTVKFKYQELTPDGVPRFPVFLGFRDANDMSV